MCRVSITSFLFWYLIENNNQFGLIPNKLNMEGIERYQMDQKNHHFVFIDLEKSYDRVPREISGKSMMNKMVMITYI